MTDRPAPRPVRPRSTEPPPATGSLFRAEELALRPSAPARIAALLRRAPAPTEAELRGRDDREAMQRLREWGADLATRFRLRYRAIEPEREGVTAHYGICYEDGLIRIRLRHARTGRLLKESSLVDTLCHELAHLRHLDHSIRFRRLYERILDRARRLGYYRPGPVRTRAATQLALFVDGGHSALACASALSGGEVRRHSRPGASRARAERPRRSPPC